jgi:hypothetical protein
MILFMTPDRAGIEAGKSLEFLDAAATGESREYLLNPAAAISNSSPVGRSSSRYGLAAGKLSLSY